MTIALLIVNWSIIVRSATAFLLQALRYVVLLSEFLYKKPLRYKCCVMFYNLPYSVARILAILKRKESTEKSPSRAQRSTVAR